MSDQNQGTPPVGGANPPADQSQNLKAEMDRKFSNVQSELAKVTQSLQALLSKSPQGPQSPPENDEDSEIEKVWLTDERRAADLVAKKAEKRIEAKLAKQAAEQTKRQQISNQLVTDFPELTDPEHELSKHAGEIYSKFEDEQKLRPEALREAALQAAVDLGYRPKSKRTQSQGDSFSVSSRGAGPSRRQESGDEEVDLSFAEKLGLNVNDPKVVESLKKRAAKFR